MRLVVLTLVLLAAAAPAIASPSASGQDPSARAEVSPLELFPDALTLIELEVLSRHGHGGFIHASAITDGQGDIAELTLPSTYELCRTGGKRCEVHPLFPGLKLRGVATSYSVPVPTPGGIDIGSAALAQPLTAVVRSAPPLDPRVNGRSKPRKLRTASGKRLSGLAWTGWGEAVARAGDVRASRLIDCGGTLHYSRVRAGSERVDVDVPCGTWRQVQPG